MPSLVSRTIKATGGDYTTLVSFESGNQGDFVTLDKVVEGVVFTPTMTALCTFSGSITDATRYWIVRADSTTKHAGVWDDTKSKYSASNSDCISMSDAYLHIYDMQFEIMVTGTRRNCISNNSSGHRYLLVERCLLRQNPASIPTNNATMNGYYNQADAIAAVVIFRNCIAMNFNGGTNIGSNGFDGQTTGSKYFYNCTAYNCKNGFRYGNDTVLKNCLSVNSGQVDFEMRPTHSLNAASTNNVSSDASASGTSAKINAVVSFVDAANYNCHLQLTDTGAAGKGADLSADPFYPHTTDIDGVTPIGRWSAGAHWIPYVEPGAKQYYNELEGMR